MKTTVGIIAVFLAVGMAIGSFQIASSSANSGVEPASAGSCVDRYNSLLIRAKASIAAGDRAAAVDLLKQARRLIAGCPALQDGAEPSSAPILS